MAKTKKYTKLVAGILVYRTLANKVVRQEMFHIQLPSGRIYRPVYHWDYKHLNLGTKVGKVTLLGKKVALTIVEINSIKINRDKIESMNGCPILHSQDDRKITDLIISEFYLSVHDINCVFELVP